MRHDIDQTDSVAPLIEGFARVLEVRAGQAGQRVLWLEPEQTTSCGSCASQAACHGGGMNAEPGIGTVANRLAARRFSLEMPAHGFAPRAGDRVVVGVSNRLLLQASWLAYGVPLLTAIVCGSVAESLAGNDLYSLLGMVGGLLAGFGLARVYASVLNRRSALSPRFLRLAQPGETCQT